MGVAGTRNPATVTLAVLLPAGPAWGRANWGTSTWAAGTEGDWTELTQTVEVSWSGGRDGRKVQPDVSNLSATLIDVSQEWFPGRFPDLVPNVPVRLTVETSPGLHVVVWSGRLVRWSIERAPGAYAAITVEAIDHAGVLAGLIRPTPTVEGAGETPTVRFARLLDAAGWPTDAREVAILTEPLLAGTDMAGARWTELADTADAARCVTWVDAAGTVHLENLDAVVPLPGPTFTDGTPPGVCYAALTEDANDDQVVNVVTGTRPGGQPVTRTAAYAQDWPRSLSATVGVTDDAAVDLWCAWRLEDYPPAAPLTVLVESDADADGWTLANTDPRLDCRVWWQGRTVLARLLSWEATINVDTGLTVAWQLWPAGEWEDL